MLKLLLATLAIVAVAMALLSIRLIVEKNGRFGAKHIGQSAAMRKRGISCVQGMDADMRRENKHRINEKTR